MGIAHSFRKSIAATCPLEFFNSIHVDPAPLQVPSAFLMTDAFLMLDERLGRKVFRPKAAKAAREAKAEEAGGEEAKKAVQNLAREDLAAIESVKAKKLLGALRTLWRSSAANGQDDKITHLKSFIMPSPARKQHDDNEPEESAHDESPSPVLPDEDSPRSEASVESDDEVSGGEMVPRSPAATESDHVDSPTLALSPNCQPPSPQGSSHQEIVAVDDNSENERDSQVPGAGWMGRAMMNARTLEWEERIYEERRNHINKFVGYAVEGLELHAGIPNAPMSIEEVQPHLEKYKEYCFKAFDDYGDDVLQKLGDLEFFEKWLQWSRVKDDEPAQDRCCGHYCRC